MLEGIFEINSYEMDDILGYIKQTSQEVESTNDEAKTTFEPNKKSEVFGNGARTINNQMDELYEQISRFGNAMQKGTSAIFNLEMKLVEEARNIQIPNGFGTNNTVTNKETSTIGLSKTDGLSVNNGVASQEMSLDDTSEIVKENLVDIMKDTPQEQRFEEEQLATKEVALNNIVKNETVAQEFNENAYTNNKKSLYEMENKDVNEINDFVDINKTKDTKIEEMDTVESREVNPEVSLDNIEINEIDNFEG